MTIKFLKYCDGVCQRKLGATWIALLGILSVAAILSILL
jgi:hypothetical protein